MVECCNVARCDSDSKTCNVGYSESTADTESGDVHLVREQLGELVDVIYTYCRCHRVFK